MLQGAQLILSAISQNHKVIFLQIRAHLIRIGSPHKDTSPGKTGMLISNNYFPLHGFGNALILRSGTG